MTLARSQLIDLDSTSYYHCISRCVRRAFLWGEDHLTGRNYSHRKQWVIDRLAELNDIFAIDICAYAVMSNHYHVVLRVDKEKAECWQAIDIIDRWAKLFSIPLLVQRYQAGKTTFAENLEAESIIQTWQQRLMDISWFMRSLNEFLARKANQEDKCKGRFWEGRFKSQALLDEVALLTCMSYVDLNPIRAGIAQTPEQSDFTSIQQRIKAHQQVNTPEDQETTMQLLPLNTKPDGHVHTLTYDALDYLQLVDWAGRAIRKDKPGYIPSDVPPILTRIGLDPAHYLKQIHSHRKTLSKSLVLGCQSKLKAFALKHGKKYLHGRPLDINASVYSRQ